MTNIFKAVIAQAVVDLAIKTRKDTSLTQKKANKWIKKRAYNWVFFNDEEFKCICINAGYEPSYIRNMIKENCHISNNDKI